MMVAHIIMNIFFAIFFVLDILVMRKRFLNRKKYIYGIITIILGIMTYATYVILLLREFTISGFDRQTLSLLILGWAFLCSAYVICKKNSNGKEVRF
jgi:hypothetical protein